MKNFKNLGRVLSKVEQKSIKGNGEWYQGGCSNGGGTQWEGSSSIVEYCNNCDTVWNTQMQTNEFGWAYMWGYGECSHP